MFSLLFSIAAFTGQAQKYAYLNSSEIIMMHPDVKAADQKLINFQGELMKKGEGMAKKLEADYNAYVIEANSGTLSQVQMQGMEASLGTQQEAIRQFEVEMKQKVLIKREELYKPILDQIQKAVEDVGAENGYMMIFDTSTGGILHAADSDNILDKVRLKLNL